MQQVDGLWPDDKQIPTTRDGAHFRMANGREYVVARTLLATDPAILARARLPFTRFIEEHPEESPVVFTTYNAEQILGRPPLSYADRARRLAREMVRRLGDNPGELKIPMSDDDTTCLEYLRASAVPSWRELLALLQYWEGQGAIHTRQMQDGTTYARLGVRGLIAFEEDQTIANSDTVFVAMWFAPELGAIYEGAIAPAIEGLGYRAVRIDRQEHNNKIDDEIIAEIRRARFVIADFSCGEDGARGGVYFEAGFAAGLGKPVIFTVREADLGRVHFDTRQFNHIVWTSADDLKTKLANRIGATIGAR